LFCGAVLARRLYPQFGSGSRLAFVLFLGTAVSITAFPVPARILADRKLTNTRAGTFAKSCARVDDVTAWCLLAIISVVARNSGGSMSLLLQFGLLAIYVLIMYFLVRPLLRRFLPSKAPPTTAGFASAMILLLASAGTAKALAVHALFGAFMAGLMMPKGGPLETELRKRLESATLALLPPLFFAWNGLRTSIGLLNNANAWVFCGLITLLAIVSKLLVSTGCARAGGMSGRESLAVGVLVNTRGGLSWRSQPL
jgi:Kef-type K+ transport system membrane component KefB